jgi:hypothetical protein
MQVPDEPARPPPFARRTEGPDGPSFGTLREAALAADPGLTGPGDGFLPAGVATPVPGAGDGGSGGGSSARPSPPGPLPLPDQITPGACPAETGGATGGPDHARAASLGPEDTLLSSQIDSRPRQTAGAARPKNALMAPFSTPHAQRTSSLRSKIPLSARRGRARAEAAGRVSGAERKRRAARCKKWLGSPRPCCPFPFRKS